MAGNNTTTADTDDGHATAAARGARSDRMNGGRVCHVLVILNLARGEQALLGHGQHARYRGDARPKITSLGGALRLGLGAEAAPHFRLCFRGGGREDILRDEDEELEECAGYV